MHMGSQGGWADGNPGLQNAGWLKSAPATGADTSHIKERLTAAEETNQRVRAELNDKTGDAYEMYQAKHFSAASKANLQDVDWRVPRVIYDKDPKYNRNLTPLFQDPSNPQASWQKYNEVQLVKQDEGDRLIDDLAKESIDSWAAELAPCGKVPPPMETILRPGCPFVQVHPGYRREDDIWERKLELRTLDEAMRGDVTQPMPRPVMFAGDFENFHEGRYVKDDCPIA